MLPFERKKLAELENRAECLGDHPSDAQKEALLNWVINNISRDNWWRAREIATCIYIDISERMGEFGL